MILQALTAYYQRLANEGESKIALEGFERKEIPFLVIIDRSGRFFRYPGHARRGGEEEARPSLHRYQSG